MPTRHPSGPPLLASLRLHLLCLGLGLAAAAPAAEPRAKPAAVFYPGASATLLVDLDQLKVEVDFGTKLGRTVRAFDPATHVILSAFSYPLKANYTPAQLRDDHLRELKKKFKFTELRTWEKDGEAGMEYFIDDNFPVADAVSIKSPGVRQKNTFIYFASGNTGMDLHVSLIRYRPADQPGVDAMLRRVTVRRDFTPAPADELQCGLVLLNDKDRAVGLKQLEQLFAREQQQPALDSAEWRRLIGALAREYFDHGAANRSYEVCIAGLAREPDNARFHYDAARGAAAERQLAVVVEHLRAARAQRTLLPVGETLPDPAVDPAFSKLRSELRFANAVHEFDPPVPPAADNLVVLALPGSPAAVRLNLAGYQVDGFALEPQDDGGPRCVLRAHCAQTRIKLIAMVFQTGGDKLDTSEKVRRRSMLTMGALGTVRNRRDSPLGDFALSTYDAQSVGDYGMIEDHSIELFFGDGHTDMLIIYQQPASELIDDAPLKRSPAGATLLKNYAPVASDEMLFGHYYYNKKDFPRASDHYERALALEKSRRSLPGDQWFVLLDLLALSHLSSAEPAQAADVCRYGLSVAPEDPLFSYYLAGSCAAQGDLAGTLKNLRAAFGHKDHLQPGQQLPDPAADDSFKRYLTDPTFLQLLVEVRTPVGR